MAERTEPTQAHFPLVDATERSGRYGTQVEQWLEHPERYEAELDDARRKIERVQTVFDRFPGDGHLEDFAESYETTRAEKVGKEARENTKRALHHQDPRESAARQALFDRAEAKGQHRGRRKAVEELAWWIWAQNGNNAARVLEACGLDSQDQTEIAA